MKTTFATLFTLLAAASAAPAPSLTPALGNSVQISGKQLQSLLSVLATQSTNSKLQADQEISCTVAYTLALSTTGPPYTIDLASLDLSNCTYTGP